MLYTADDAVFITEIEIRNFDAYRSEQSMAFSKLYVRMDAFNAISPLCSYSYGKSSLNSFVVDVKLT